MKYGKANIVIDGQWGSTGKGKLAGFLALKHDIALSTCNFMSNAGHTWVGDNGEKIITCQLPSACVNEDCMLIINSGAAITLSKFFEEIEKYNINTSRIFIHPNAAIITEYDREIEAGVLKKISSTLKGCGGCLSRKVMRTAHLAKDEPRLSSMISNTTNITSNVLKSGGTVLVEGAQGFDLSLNHGYRYPFCTSRDITPMYIMNDAGIPFPYLGDVYGTLRTYPIRVGNVVEGGKQTGYSGPFYPDQEELNWDIITQSSGSPKLVERTTVTNKIRRVFTFSLKQLDKFIQVCAPDKLFINFINYINYEDYGIRTMSELSEKSKHWLMNLTNHLELINSSNRFFNGVNISYIGTGSKNCEMIEL